MVYKYTSAKEVIAKIYSDLDIQEELHRVSDIKEWITEAIEKIGAFDQFVKKRTTLPVRDFTVMLPADFHGLIQCAYSLTRDNRHLIPMEMATGSFDCLDSDRHTNKIWDDYGSSVLKEHNVMRQLIELVKNVFYAGRHISDNEAKDIILRLSNGDLYHDTKDCKIYDKDTLKTPGNALKHDNYGRHIMPILLSMINTNISDESINSSSPTTNFKPVYSFNGGCIRTNIRYGYITLAYNAYMLDNDGYPMIPDNASYKEAIYWYVVMKLKFPELLSGRINGNVYQEIKSNWHIYRKQAYGECNMPDTGEMQAITNHWLRLVPEFSDYYTFFKYSGDPQIMYNKDIPTHRRGNTIN